MKHSFKYMTLLAFCLCFLFSCSDGGGTIKNPFENGEDDNFIKITILRMLIPCTCLGNLLIQKLVSIATELNWITPKQSKPLVRITQNSFLLIYRIMNQYLYPSH